MSPGYDWNTTIFQRPYGLAQQCHVDLFTRWESNISREILDLVSLHRAPRTVPRLSRLTYFLYCLAGLWRLRRRLHAIYTPAGTAIFIGWLAHNVFRLRWVVE